MGSKTVVKEGIGKHPNEVAEDTHSLSQSPEKPKNGPG